MTPTPAMVDAALDAWWDGSADIKTLSTEMQEAERRDMSAALTAALAVSGYGEVVEALKTAEAALADIGDADREPGDDVVWCERRAAKDLPTIRAALARVTQDPQS